MLRLLILARISAFSYYLSTVFFFALYCFFSLPGQKYYMIFSISFYLRKIFVFSFQLFEQSPADPLPSQPSKIFIFTFPYIILCNTLAQMPRDMRNYISRALNFHCQVSFSEHPSAFFERSAKPALILAERDCFDLFPVSLGLTAFAQLKLFDAAGSRRFFIYKQTAGL